ncbi:MAG: DUF6067 family protein [Flavobacteriales bacterium]|nr:DUF6067 family protein [Flavobacteriales bacterium]
MNIRRLAFYVFFISLICGQVCSAQNTLQWKDSAASVMAKINIGVGKAVVADVIWGLPFPVEKYTPEQMYATVKVFNHQSGIRISNFYIRELTAERLTVAFEPLGSGEYDIYFSPQNADEQHHTTYTSPDQWVKKLNLSNYPDFNSLNKYTSHFVYYKNRANNPYDYIATDIRASMYFSSSVPTFQSYLIPWKYPINEYNRLPDVWVEKLLAPVKKSKKNVHLQKDTITLCRGGKNIIQTAVVGVRGKEYLKTYVTGLPKEVSLRSISPVEFNIKEKEIKTQWALLSASKTAAVGYYDVEVSVKNDGAQVQKMPFVLHVTDKWTPDDDVVDFISSVGEKVEKEEVHGATLGGRLPSVVSSGNDVLVGEHRIKVNRATALPSQITCRGENMFSSPVLLVFSTANGIRKISVPQVEIQRDGVSSVEWRAEVETYDMDVEVINNTNAYGVISYKAVITPKSDVDFRNVTLEFDFSPSLTMCGYDTLEVKDKKEYSVSAEELNAGMWVAADSLGACLSVPKDSNNAFYTSAEAKMSLYHSCSNGIVVGTGAFVGRVGDVISVQCDMQLLPAKYSSYQKPQGEAICELSSGNFPDVVPYDMVIVKDPFSIMDDKNVALFKKWHEQGKKVYLSLDGYVLPSVSLASRILASMGYDYCEEEGGRFMRFDSSESLIMPFRNMHKTMCMPYYISGVVFSPRWYDMIDVEGYYELKKRKKTEFNLFMRTQDMGAGVFRTAPWLDALLKPAKNQTENWKNITGLPVYNVSKKGE